MGQVRTFLLGVVVGVGVTAFLAPASRRQQLAELTDRLAAGDVEPVELVRQYVEGQKVRWQRALDVARQVAEQRQKELWEELKLPPSPEQEAKDGERA